ncbi:His-Xaa-Ser system radical SAM maturase HxsC [Neorhizobium sp. BT27B]|uniref:His-Xaa-Ser system radical SAM maturase HxsC n=1 Tax=Neorhizobium sp. BT27B TaxID=3142625 RepID=UPI003D2DB829
MIDLRLEIDPLPIVEPLVIRLTHEPSKCETEHDAVLVETNGTRLEYDYNGFSLVLRRRGDENFDGDVILALPGQRTAHRLIRSASPHNTFLVTEQCDQLCVMCSQPPKKYHTDLFSQFAVAASLAPINATIGISGGEPLLHKDRLFSMVEAVALARPDIKFHILSNGQHLIAEDVRRLATIGTERILWGIPLYAADGPNHDRIVGKEGAFHQLQRGLAILMKAGASVELRTVVMQQNKNQLVELADFVFTRLSAIEVWAIMQMERIGYGRMNWATSFQDSSTDFAQIAKAIDLSAARGIPVALYNFPLCSVPAPYREFALSTISDWKRKYLDICEKCGSRAACGGFFEWYSQKEGFAALGAI